MGKLADNKRRNEQSILSAAIELFATKGFEETSISDIVSSSQLARGTFYNYFSNKEEIWERCLDNLISAINASLIEERIKAKTKDEFLYNTFYSYLQFFSNPTFFQLIIRNQPIFRKTLFSSHSLKSVYSHLEKDLIDSHFFDGLSPTQFKMISYSMVGSAVELLIQTNQEGEQISAEELSTFFKDLFWGGMKGMLER
ncbi:MAG: TetR/AcrR family transcriptional regulator [Bacteroidota bacterium]